MAITYKVLGQSAPTDTNNTDVYTVGAGKTAVVSSLTLTNVTPNAATARVFVRVTGAGAATSNAIVYDASVAGNSTIALTLGLTLAAADVLTVRSSISNALTFQVFGQENS